MTLSAQGFPGSVTDEGFSKLLSLIGNDGTSGFNVSGGGSGTTLRVRVSAGISHLSGVLIESTATETVTLLANGSSFDRIDLIILRAVWGGSGSFELTYRQGTPSSNPQPPTLTRQEGVQWELPLAQVRLSSGHGEITSGDITRTNTPPEKGFYHVTSIGQAPYEEGALFYYAPASSLRVKTTSGDIEIAGLRTNAFVELPSGPPNWSGLVRYVKANRWVSVSVELRRSTQAQGTDGNDVNLGTLPGDFRPPVDWFGVGVNEESGRACPIVAQPNGQVWARAAFIAAGHRLRGGVTFPVN